MTKRAHRDQIGKGEFKTNFGTNSLYGFGADYTGKMTDDESVRYRIVASLNHANGEWKDTENKTIYLAPTLEWDISDRTRLSILTSYQKDYGTPSSNFYPQEGTLRALPDGSYYSRNVNFGDPVNDHETNKQYSLGYELSHDFGNGLRANSSYRYSHVENYHRGAYIYPSAYAVDWSPLAPSETGYLVTANTVYNNGTAIAGFHAKDTGALISNGTGATVSSADPIYRKGFELQADVNLTENWTGTLAYTYTKSESKDSTGTKTRRPLIPTNTLAAKTAYTFSNGMLNGLTVGAGIRYVGHSVTSKGSLYSHARLPSVTLVDLMARYQINQNWSAQLNVDNVGNRKYVAACDYYCYYGAERKVNATVSYKF